MKCRQSLLLIVGMALLWGACKTAESEKPDELLGLPPTEKEDPFFFVTLPAEAKEAEASGMIGEPSDEEETGNATTVEPPKTKSQCFSCVKICEGRDCNDSDSICGWGVDFDKNRAMMRATAECDGALDIARANPQWKKITGNCPVATCQ